MSEKNNFIEYNSSLFAGVSDSELTPILINLVNFWKNQFCRWKEIWQETNKEKEILECEIKKLKEEIKKLKEDLDQRLKKAKKEVVTDAELANNLTDKELDTVFNKAFSKKGNDKPKQYRIRSWESLEKEFGYEYLNVTGNFVSDMKYLCGRILNKKQVSEIYKNDRIEIDGWTIFPEVVESFDEAKNESI